MKSFKVGDRMNNIEELVGVEFFENREHEYKLQLESSNDKIEKWAKTLVGFANTYGGYLFVGITNDLNLVGLNKDEIDKTKNLVLKTINRYIFPHIEVKFKTYKCNEEKYILSIWTDYVNEIVIYKSGDFSEKVYLREDGSTVLASVSQILAMGKRKFGVDKQVLNIQYETKNFTKFNKLSVLYRRDSKKIDEKVLISKEVESEDGRITEGLRMFSDNFESDITLAVCRLWNSYDKGSNEVIDKKEFKGSLCDVFTNIMDFVKRNSRSGFIKMGDGSRLDTVSYPIDALREAVINALAHRDYSIEGTQIDVDIFKDKLVITSPGKWLLSKKPSEYKLDTIPSIRRNKVICACFEALGLMERSGSGLKKIYNVYKELNFKEPEIDEEHDYFLITLYDLLALHDNVITATTKYDKIILEFCKNYARSREEIQEHIGIKSRSYFTLNILKPLVKSGALIQTSSLKSKYSKYITALDK